MPLESSAPARIDLAGGTYDIWPLYLFHDGAQTVNVAIGLRARCHISARRDHRVCLTSDDTGDIVDAPDPAALPLDRLPLVARLVRHFGARGIDVRTRSESPVGAGIGGSSAMAVAIAGGLAAWTGRTLDDEALLTLAMNVEAQVLCVPTGVQDYRPALFGGTSAIELGVTGARRVALDVARTELERRVVLAYTGASRDSGLNNWDVMTRRLAGDPVVRAAFDGIRDAAAAVRAALERRAWRDVAAGIAAEWAHRQRLAPGVSTPAIDRMLARAREAGALAGKVCGAGGGGCLFCLVDPDAHGDVTAALAAEGARILPFSVDPRGLVVERT